jgi:hypothetical protein
MTLLQDVQAKFLQDEFEFSKHAVDQSVLRDISVIEIREALACGEIIKDCPDPMQLSNPSNHQEYYRL